MTNDKEMRVSLKSPIFHAGVILFVALVVYIPAMRAGFIWDDDSFLTQNPLIRADDGLYRFWFTTEPPDYFPLVSSVLWLEWRLWGMNATGYHVVNVVLHAVSAVLIWLVLRRLKIPGAWLAALIFAVHPVNVESVAWITERKNTQPMVFYLVTILSYLRFETDGQKRWYVLSLFLFLLAVLSKTSVVMLPLVLLGCAWWQRGSIVRKDLVRSIPFFVLSAVLGLATVWFQYNTIGDDLVRTDGFFARLAGTGWAAWFYSYKAVIPYKLAFVYPRWEIDASKIISYLPVIMLLGCFVVFWRYRKRWGKGFLFGLGYYVVTLFPVLGFFNIYFMKYSLVADHWQYTSIIGIIALAVGVGNHLRSRCNVALRKLLSVAAVFLICLFCILTWRQGNMYTDVETLWRDTISKNPRAWIAHNNLGVVLKQQGRFDEAIAHYYEVLMIKPDDVGAHSNLGLALYEQGKLDEAIGHFSKALQMRPDYAEAYMYLGIASYEKGKPYEAIGHYRKALHIKPDYAGAHSNLGIVFASEGRLEEAMHHFSRALWIEPDFAEAHHNLGLALAKKSKLEEAMHHFSEAVRIDPDYVDAHYNLGLALARKGRLEDAQGHFSEALRIEPDRAELHYSLGLALAFRGSSEEAIPYFSRAVKINPEFAEAHYNLGAILASHGKLEESIRHFSEALRIKPDFAEAKQSLRRALREVGRPEEISNIVTGH